MKEKKARRDKLIQITCTQEEYELFTKVSKKTGMMPTSFVRYATLEKCKEIYEKNKKTWIQECSEILEELENK